VSSVSSDYKKFRIPQTKLQRFCSLFFLPRSILIFERSIFIGETATMKRLKQIIEESDTAAGRLFDLLIQLLVLMSIVSFSVETMPNLSRETDDLLESLELATVLLFTVEYLARLVVADAKWRFIFSFYGIVDLLAILPFYLSTGIDLRSLRIFRLLRLFRLLKLVRYSRAINRFHVAFLAVKEELVLFFSVTLILLYLTAVGIYYFEHDAQPEAFASIFHSLWWAVATLTTVGYGDVYPVTVGGRIFTFFILMIGLGIVAVPSGLLASALTSRNGDDSNPSE